MVEDVLPDGYEVLVDAKLPARDDIPAVYFGVVTLPIGAVARPWMPDRMPCSSAQSSAAGRGPACAWPAGARDAAPVSASSAATATAVTRVSLSCRQLPEMDDRDRVDCRKPTNIYRWRSTL